MYVCLCQAVTDRDIHEAAKNGATCLKVSVDCGRCASFARKCLKTANENFAASQQAA